MPYVLVVITVFSSSAGVASDTRFHEFSSRTACESARVEVERGVREMKGTLGRELFAACFPRG